MSTPENKKLPAFPSPFVTRMTWGEGAAPKPIPELEMMKLSATIRRKSSWYEKMKNPKILAKWRKEATEEGLTRNQVNYVFDELNYYASLRDPITGMEVSDVDGVWNADKLIDKNLRKELLEGVKVLENIPVSKRDWHPGTDKQVWNLVHPSLYPFMYGKTKILQVDATINSSGSGASNASTKRTQLIERDTEVKLYPGLAQDEPHGGIPENDVEPVSPNESIHEEVDTDSSGNDSDNANQEAGLAASSSPDGSNTEEETDEDKQSSDESSEHDDDGDEPEREVNSDDPYQNASNSEDSYDAYPNSYIREYGEYSISKKFCWLPTDFIVDNDNTVRSASYINNLHPDHHKPLYRTLEKIFSKFVPLFEKVLQDQLRPIPSRIPMSHDWDEQHGRYLAKCEDPDNDFDADFNEGFSVDGSSSDESNDSDRSKTPKKFPDAPKLHIPRISPEASERITLSGKTVQVIVKLANIMLTPKKPEYVGGVWHVEGMKNENIVASGIYYYDVTNISESELAFRQQVHELGYLYESDFAGREVYGIGEHDPLNQFLGSVKTPQHRCLAFPNLYQHQVQPFKLSNPTKPGYRKILVFFLVDPGNPIVSTTRVAPQQLDWYTEELYKVPLFTTLPLEIQEHVLKFVKLDGPLPLSVAKKLRRKLMKERKYFVYKNNKNFFERPFSLCEH